MAYGKNKKRKDWDFRAYPLGIGAATQSKKGACQVLMTRVLDLMQAMSEKCFVKEPLAHDDSLEQIEQTLIEMQSQCDTLNAVWAEQARKHVKTALQESSKRYFRRLAGSLRHVDTALNVKPTKLSKAQAKRLAEFVGPPEKKRKFVHVPWQIQDEISDWELAELKEAAEQGTAVDLFRRLLVHSDACDLTHNQIAILRDIHRQTQDKHTVPDFGAKGQFTLQLHLDYRMLPSVKRKGQPDKPSEAICLRDGEAYVLKDKKNRKYRRFLDIAGVLPRAPRLRIPVVLTRKIAERMAGTNKEWASIIIELTSDRGEAPTIGARLVCGKPPEAKKIDLKAVTCIVGRDFGYVNTIALSVATITNPVDLTGHTGKEILDDSREEAQAYFEDHVRREGVQIVERLKFEGRHLLDRIARCCDKIDSYTSRIDQGYNALERLRAKIFDTMGLDKNDRITSGLKKTFAGDMVREFFQLLGNIHSLKKARRACYRKISGIKKAWFGFLSNKEVELAEKYGAVIVRENMTAEAIEKDDPEYRGCLFNKMMNNGSKGIYQRSASEKLSWNGIPELLIASWYTSRSCTVHSKVIDKKHRQGESIYLPCCGQHDHADLHAGDTIASYLFLQPRITAGDSVTSGS